MSGTSSNGAQTGNTLDADVSQRVRDLNRGADIKRSRQEEAIRGVFNQAVRDMKPLIELLTEARAAGVEVGLKIEAPQPPGYRVCVATLVCPELEYHVGPVFRTGLKYELSIESGRISIDSDPSFGGLDNVSDQSIADFVSMVKKGIVTFMASTKLGESVPPELPEPFTF